MSEVEVVKEEVRGLREDVAEIKGAIIRLADSAERQVRLEERHASQSAALERAFGALGKLDARIRTLEQAQPVQQLATDWVGRAVWSALGLLAALLLNKLGVPL